MAFDGVTVAAVVSQLRETILNGRLYKIAQPEKDELLLTVKNEGGQHRLMLSADASLPLIYLTEENKKSPMTAPNFCMLLRKHIQNGRIIDIRQPGLERVIQFEIEHLDEMGDLRHKTLVMELMGKHSNIIFHDENGMILDSIKHVSGMVSSVREVLPGRTYFIPETMDKTDPVLGIRYQSGGKTLHAVSGEGTREAMDSGKSRDNVDGENTQETIDGGKVQSDIGREGTQDAVDSGKSQDNVDGGNTQEMIDGGKVQGAIGRESTNDTVDSGKSRDNVDGGNTRETIDSGKVQSDIGRESTHDAVDSGKSRNNMGGDNTQETVESGELQDTTDGERGAGLTEKQFREQLLGRASSVYKAIYAGFTGISPIVAQEICYRAGLDADFPVNALQEDALARLYESFAAYMEDVREGKFAPFIVYEHNAPVEFGVLPFTIYKENKCRYFDSISETLSTFYAEKSAQTRIRQKSVDLRRIVTTALERNVKKYDLQAKQLKDTEKREKYRVYGELLHTYGYQAKEGEKRITVENYYTGEELTIPLDPDLSAMENAAKYFEKYNKLKRTFEAVTGLLKETGEEIEHLESVMNALDIAQAEEDLVQIKEELVQSGYIRYKGGKKKEKITSRPMHFISSDGFDMYVGKNNFQNEEITFKLAQGNDWWFHAKGMPGSHVIVKNGGREVPDRTFEEAGRLAAHFSRAKGADRVEVDYIERKHVKKPGGGKPGFVVYYTNYSLLIDADISGIRKVE